MELDGDHNSTGSLRSAAVTAAKDHHNSESTSFSSTGGNLLSDLLRSCSKQEPADDFFKQESSFKDNPPSFKEEASKHFSPDDLAKEFKCEPIKPANFSSTNDNRDDRPDYSPFESGRDQQTNSRPDSKPSEEDTSSRSKPPTAQMLANQMVSQMMETDASDANSCAMSDKGKNSLSLMNELLRCKGQPSATSYKIEDDFYAELPANTPLQELVRCALTKQGYSVEDCSAAKGKRRFRCFSVYRIVFLAKFKLFDCPKFGFAFCRVASRQI